MPDSPRLAILTVSDRTYMGLREDLSGPLITDWGEHGGFTIAETLVLPDDPDQISETLQRWTLGPDPADLILTTGGTGLSPRDRTPEATLSVADRIIPGIPEWIRTTSAQTNPLASLSRGVAVQRGRTLIINLPGSPRGVREWLELLERVLPHALEQAGQNPRWDPNESHFTA